MHSKQPVRRTEDERERLSDTHFIIRVEKGKIVCKDRLFQDGYPGKLMKFLTIVWKMTRFL